MPWGVSPIWNLALKTFYTKINVYFCVIKRSVKKSIFDHCLIDQTWSKIPKIEKNWFLRLRFNWWSINWKKIDSTNFAHQCTWSCTHAKSETMLSHQECAFVIDSYFIEKKSCKHARELFRVKFGQKRTLPHSTLHE